MNPKFDLVMWYERLTPGALRAIQKAHHLESTFSLEYSVCLLATLLAEESKAAELLHEQGVSFDDVCESLLAKPPETIVGLLDRFAPESIRILSAGNLAMVRRAEQSASMTATQQTAAEQTGTEHLLHALMLEDCLAGDFLRKKEFFFAQAGPTSDAQAAAESISIEPEFRLKLDTPSNQGHLETLRIIDAAANRAREGLRVVEDFVRFAKDSSQLTELCKQIRHRLSETIRRFHVEDRMKSRETTADVGTSISTIQERHRADLNHVVQANLARLQESLRSLEESSKTIQPELSSEFEAIRYQTYTLEKLIIINAAAHTNLQGVDVCLLVTDELCPRGYGPVVRAALASGIRMIQLRQKQTSDQRLLEMAKWIREWTHEAEAIFILNDRPDIAVLAEADGVHIGQTDLSVHDVRQIVGTKKLVGLSTHNMEQARQAVLSGADYIGMGPTFPSTTKQFNEFAGLPFISEVARGIDLPAFAIGGISLENAPHVIEAGARRIAISSAICAAEDPAAVAARFVQLMEGQLEPNLEESES